MAAARATTTASQSRATAHVPPAWPPLSQDTHCSFGSGSTPLPYRPGWSASLPGSPRAWGSVWCCRLQQTEGGVRAPASLPGLSVASPWGSPGVLTTQWTGVRLPRGCPRHGGRGFCSALTSMVPLTLEPSCWGSAAEATYREGMPTTLLGCAARCQHLGTLQGQSWLALSLCMCAPARPGAHRRCTGDSTGRSAGPRALARSRARGRRGAGRRAESGSSESRCRPCRCTPGSPR